METNNLKHKNNMELDEIINTIKKGNDAQFTYDKKTNTIKCKCGYTAIWIRTGFVCGTITAYPCEYNKLNKENRL